MICQDGLGEVLGALFPEGSEESLLLFPTEYSQLPQRAHVSSPSRVAMCQALGMANQSGHSRELCSLLGLSG